MVAECGWSGILKDPASARVGVMAGEEVFVVVVVVVVVVYGGGNVVARNFVWRGAIWGTEPSCSDGDGYEWIAGWTDGPPGKVL